MDSEELGLKQLKTCLFKELERLRLLVHRIYDYLFILIQLIDQTVTDIKDVGVNFFLHKSDVGKIRSQVVAPRLRDLNPICAVSTSTVLDETIIMYFLIDINIIFI